MQGSLNEEELYIHIYEEHGLAADVEDVDLKLEREKYLQSTLANKQKQKKQRKENSSEDDSSSSDSSAKNKPYRTTATKRGLARLENKTQGISSSVEAMDDKLFTYNAKMVEKTENLSSSVEILGETIAENNVNIKSETEKLSSSMKAMGDKLFKDVTHLTHNTAIITNALADTQDALKDNEKKSRAN